MIESIESALASTLLRTLQIEPTLTPAGAIARIDSLLTAVPSFPASSSKVRQYLESIAGRLRRRGVLNPAWLMDRHHINHYFCFVRAHPTWQLLLAGQGMAAHATQYFLWGDWDVLISMHAVQAEFEDTANQIQAMSPYAFLGFSAARVHLFHRHRVRSNPLAGFPPDQINRIVEDYDDPAAHALRERLERTGVLLGPTWQLDVPPATDISAYVGITPRPGLYDLPPETLLDELLANEAASTCLVHFMELTHATPFRYLAKLTFADFEELERVADVLNFGAGPGRQHRGSRLAFETKTYIVARVTEQLPRFRTAATRGVIGLAKIVLEEFEPEATASLNELEARLQAAVIVSLAELRDKATDGPWPPAAGDQIAEVIGQFSEAALAGAHSSTLHAPVLNIGTLVASEFKSTLERAARCVFGQDLVKTQNELNLRTSRFQELALGNVATILGTIKGRDDFSFLADALDDVWLDRLARFAEARSQWLHGGQIASTPSEEMDAARRMIGEGIELLRWLHADVVPPLAAGDDVPPGGMLVPAPSSRSVGTFVSYSTADTGTAERIAASLRALGFPVWYADWSIDAGESIVVKVNEALQRTDTLLALLSRRSVESKWVWHEITSAMMRQLAGYDVIVVPVLIERVEVPPVLGGLKRIDMTPNRYETGLQELIHFLSARQRQRAFC